MKGHPPAELVEIESSVPDSPVFLYDLWEWFLTLNNTRARGFGASPITEQEIQAFCHNRGMRLSLFEIDAIRTLDRIAMIDYSKEPDDGG